MPLVLAKRLIKIAVRIFYYDRRLKLNESNFLEKANAFSFPACGYATAFEHRSKVPFSTEIGLLLNLKSYVGGGRELLWGKFLISRGLWVMRSCARLHKG
jgi:hypothetical protein